MAGTELKSNRNAFSSIPSAIRIPPWRDALRASPPLEISKGKAPRSVLLSRRLNVAAVHSLPSTLYAARWSGKNGAFRATAIVRHPPNGVRCTFSQASRQKRGYDKIQIRVSENLLIRKFFVHLYRWCKVFTGGGWSSCAYFVTKNREVALSLRKLGGGNSK